ncbi:MAG: hypothetical protein NWQ21_11415 [Desulfobacterales bacterium]|nr:hypothetical protein [Desulfobacterales bacterium]
MRQFRAEPVSMMISPGLIGRKDLLADERSQAEGAGLPALHGIVERYNNSAARGASLISGIPHKKTY